MADTAKLNITLIELYEIINNKLNSGDLTKSKLQSIIGEATASSSGLMSATDKSNLNTLVGLLGSGDTDNIINTIREILEIFENYPEGTNILELINSKLTKAQADTYYVPKTEYEWNQQVIFGSSDLTKGLLIGRFPCYDTNITVLIKSTTNTTYYGQLVVATQNINLNAAGSIVANVYGDTINTLAPALTVVRDSLSTRNISIYFKPTTYSKHLIHVQAVALSGTPTNMFEKVETSAIPDNASEDGVYSIIKPTNGLTANFQPKGNYLTSFTESDPTVPAWAKAENKPTYSWGEITSKPTIPTKTSELTNDSGFITTAGGRLSGDLELYTTSGDSPKLVFLRGTDTDSQNDWQVYDSGGSLYFENRGSTANWDRRIGIMQDGGITLYNNGNIKKNTGSATYAYTLPNQSGTVALTSDIKVDSALSTTSTNPVQNKVITSELAKYALSSQLANYALLTDIPDVPEWALASSKPSYSYSELTGKPTIPTKTSELTNDSGFVTGSYLPLSGGSLNSDAIIKLTQYGTRTLTLSGNSIVADMSKDTDGWAGAFASVKHNSGSASTQTTTTMLGWYGSATNLTHIFMGGTYSDPFLKFTPAGVFTFKNTPYVGTTKVALISDLPTVPTKTSQLTNDSGFITSSALSPYATNSSVDTKIANVKQEILGTGVEEAYDTLVEIQKLLKEDDAQTANIIANINTNTANIASNTTKINTNTSAISTINTNLAKKLSIVTDNGNYLNTRTYLSTHPENSNASILPFIYNDLGHLLSKGGSCSIYTTSATSFTSKDTLTAVKTLSASKNLFDGSPSYQSNFSSILTQNTANTNLATDTLVIDVTLHKNFVYGTIFYIDFGAVNWLAPNIRVLVMNSSSETAYTQVANVTNQTLGSYYVNINRSSTGFNKLRIVLAQPRSSLRIGQIGLINYSSAGASETLLSRGGGSMYGSINPYANKGASLGTSTLQWNNIYGGTLYENGTSLANKYAQTSNLATVATSGRYPDLSEKPELIYRVASSGSTAGTWIGTSSDITSYYDGLAILYKLPVAGASTTTLNINSLGAKRVYRNNNSALTTHYPVGSVLVLVYDTTLNSNAGGWRSLGDYDSTEVQSLRTYYGNYYTGSNPLYSYKICGEDAQGRIQPLTLQTGTGTSKTVNTAAFKPDKFYYYSSTTTVNANSVIAHGALYYANGNGNAAYTFNSTISTYREIYLKGTYNTTIGLFTLDNTSATSWYVQVPYNTAYTNSSYFTTGYQYIYLGRSYSSNNYWYLYPEHKMYEFDGTNLIDYDTYKFKKYGALAGGTSSANQTWTGYNIFSVDNSYNTLATQKFKLGNSASAFVIGGDGLQCFSGLNSTTGKTMYINFYGGDVLIGKSGGTQNVNLQGTVLENGTALSNKYQAKNSKIVTSDYDNLQIQWSGSVNSADWLCAFVNDHLIQAIAPSSLTVGAATKATQDGNGKVIADTYLPLSGGTLTGNLTVGSASIGTNGYVTGTWLRTTANVHLASSTYDIPVLSDGWIYSRTKDEFIEDLGLSSGGSVDLSGYGQLAGTNTWSGSNTFNSLNGIRSSFGVQTSNIYYHSSYIKVGNYQFYLPTVKGTPYQYTLATTNDCRHAVTITKTTETPASGGMPLDVYDLSPYLQKAGDVLEVIASTTTVSGTVYFCDTAGDISTAWQTGTLGGDYTVKFTSTGGGCVAEGTNTSIFGPRYPILKVYSGLQLTFVYAPANYN